jgi:peptidoglycan/LPS O-acetylase OafA/YrhL
VVDALGSRPVEYGGRISFSVYMTHGIVLLLSPVRFIGIEEAAAWPLAVRIALAAGQFLVVLGAGALVYHAIERPGQRLTLRLFGRRTRNASEPTVSASERRAQRPRS